VALGVESLAIESGNATGLLSPVLKGVEAQGHEARGVGDIEHPEYAAFQPRAVIGGVSYPGGTGRL
jgi:hypothetical protein